MHIKPLHALTTEELRDMAFTAADNGEQAHEACPQGLTADQRNDFHSAYVERRQELLAAPA